MRRVFSVNLHFVSLLTLVAAIMAGCAGSQAAGSIRLYVLDCGYLQRSDTNPGRYGLTLEQVGTSDFADPCYVVAHPDGVMLWETGIIPDQLVPAGGVEIPAGGDDLVNSNRVDRTLLSQLADIGYTPADITFVAVSHRHADHVANLNLFAGSTWLVQEPEYDAMYGDDGRSRSEFEHYREMQYAETVLLNGDRDVFGDGRVMIKSTPGHTEGHQSLFVNLERTGPVVLGGGLYHFLEERMLDTYPDFEVDLEQTLASRAMLDELLGATGAQLWIHHDLERFQGRRQAPDFYD